jgi:hypothetical protein
MTHGDVLAPSLGLEVLLDLERGLALDDLRERLGDYATATGYDESLNILMHRTGAALDLGNVDHRTAVLTWLRQWGCRHLNHASETTSAAALLAWAQTWVPQLPNPTRVLTELSTEEMITVAVACGHLSTAVAGARRLATRDDPVTFGPTAAAKTMYALRPNACAPWDDPIRHGLGMGRNDAAYRAYLQLIALALTKTADRVGVAIEDLPARVGRAKSSPPKLIDEYLWMRITRGIAP